MENENTNISSDTYTENNIKTVEDLSTELSRQSRRYSKAFEEEMQARTK
ncbi:MAG: hypothetical protein PUD24_02015 [Oscillospiraceae bacterium]|nr:hypothetical protein [Oscillospiraceae bacterium]